ncbi:hypothetical protein OQH61_03700 [Helicobacter sp. MIT 21-1697]|nr:hypothetical protein [Helicobacter sp. MIT 21-1697]MCX2716839.1 hypothetical protein [Helicobacter sp. MIT 21-1697]
MHRFCAPRFLPQIELIFNRRFWYIALVNGFIYALDMWLLVGGGA